MGTFFSIETYFKYKDFNRVRVKTMEYLTVLKRKWSNYSNFRQDFRIRYKSGIK